MAGKSKKADSSVDTAAQETHDSARSSSNNTNTKETGFFLNASTWLLSRLPWFKDRYYNWSRGKRIFVGLLMYLICLPVIPIVIGVVLYVRDPEGFRHSKAFPILGGLVVAWLGAFGLIAMQPPKLPPANSTTQQTTKSTVPGKANTTKTTKDTSDTKTSAAPSESKKKVQNQSKSEPSLGRSFKNCDAAFEAGVYNIAKSDASYADHLDGDDDGIACEK